MNPPPPRSRAFTLVEMLASMVLLALVVALLGTCYSNISKVTQQILSQKERNQESRSALEWIGRELAQARIPLPGAAGASQGLQFLLNPDSTHLSSAQANPHAAFWQMAGAKSSDSLGMAETGYFVRWIAEGGFHRPILCRLSIPQTQGTAWNPNYLVYSSPTAWVTPALLDNQAPGTSANNYLGWFSDNVLALWLRALDRAGSPILRDASGNVLNGAFDSRLGYTDSAGKVIRPPALPPSVEIALVIADSRAFDRNTVDFPVSSTLGKNPVSFWSDIDAYVAGLPPVLRPHVRVQSTRAYLPGAN